MRTHVALLKGINVGGRNLVKMADLREIFSTLHLDAAETLLQSGNVVFRSTGESSIELEEILRAEVFKQLRLDVPFFVRAADEWERMIADNPFISEAAADPSHLLVHFMNCTPLAFDVDRVQSLVRGPEVIRCGHKHLYVLYPDGIGTSTIGRTPGWSRLASDSTARNWNTILKLNSLIRD